VGKELRFSRGNVILQDCVKEGSYSTVYRGATENNTALIVKEMIFKHPLVE
jgi:hypothetical protein